MQNVTFPLSVNKITHIIQVALVKTYPETMAAMYIENIVPGELIFELVS